MKELIKQAKEDIRAGKDLATLRAHLLAIINKLEGTLIPEQMSDTTAQHMLAERTLSPPRPAEQGDIPKPKPQLQIVNFRDPRSPVSYVNSTSDLEVIHISEDSGDIRLYYRIIS